MTNIRKLLTAIRASEYALWGIFCAAVLFLGAGVLALSLQEWPGWAARSIAFYALVWLVLSCLLSVRLYNGHRLETRVTRLEMDHEFASAQTVAGQVHDIDARLAALEQ